ncbi:MAG TPA: PP2C family serine/threonine-protein phosphatase [Thermoanaerobaculia bacterium]
MSAWRYAAASAVGTSHEKQQRSCEDAHRCEVLQTAAGEAVLATFVSDGAGSALRAEAGSELACSLALDEVRNHLTAGGGIADLDISFVTAWLARLRTEVIARAEAESLRPREFACTLLGAVVGPESATFFQVGDGAIVVSQEDEYRWIFWPASGEYENSTYFATEANAAEHLQHAYVEQPIDELALFSDGLQRLVLDFRNRTAPAPFFRSMLSWVRAAGDDELPRLSAHLTSHLSSSVINDRTDDDKTLVLATRRR